MANAWFRGAAAGGVPLEPFVMQRVTLFSNFVYILASFGIVSLS